MRISSWMILVVKSFLLKPARICIPLLAGILLIFLYSCDTPPPKKIELKSLSGRTMGTSYHIKLAAEIPLDKLQSLHTKIDELLYRINLLMSTYIPESEISRFNSSKSTKYFPVSPEIIKVVKQSLVVSKASNGAFDITVGALVNLWGFGIRDNKAAVPTQEQINELKKNLGYANIITSDKPSALKKLKPGVTIDLSAIAKGFAVDEVARLIKKNGIKNFMVEIGGEIKTGGLKGQGKPWILAIESPVKGQRGIQKLVALSGQAMATSGDYRNYFKKDSKIYSHTLDPKTGRPVTHKLASVSVILSSTMLADAWATALMVQGPEKALKTAELNNLAVFLIIRSDAGFIEKQSSGFKEFIFQTRNKP